MRAALLSAPAVHRCCCSRLPASADPPSAAPQRTPTRTSVSASARPQGRRRVVARRHSACSCGGERGDGAFLWSWREGDFPPSAPERRRRARSGLLSVIPSGMYSWQLSSQRPHGTPLPRVDKDRGPLLLPTETAAEPDERTAFPLEAEFPPAETVRVVMSCVQVVILCSALRGRSRIESVRFPTHSHLL